MLKLGKWRQTKEEIFCFEMEDIFSLLQPREKLLTKCSDPKLTSSWRDGVGWNGLKKAGS
jgi:hypothetical protein